MASPSRDPVGETVRQQLSEITARDGSRQFVGINTTTYNIGRGDIGQASINANVLHEDRLRDLHSAAPAYHMPMKQDGFQGRTQELSAMIDHMCGTASPNRLRAFAIYGMGGVGKSRLALEFAWYCRENNSFDAIFWIESESSLAMGQSFQDIAICLKLARPGHGDDRDTSVFLVQEWLKTTKSSWLLVYNNVEDYDILSNHLPACAGHILITTRYRHTAFALRNQGVTKPLELRPLDIDQSIVLFQEMRRRYRQSDSDDGDITDWSSVPGDDRAAILELLEKLQGLPLGIEHMAAYIESEELSIQEFLEMYRETAKAILARASLGLTAAHTLDTLWATSFEKIRESMPDAYELLRVISLLSPDNVSLTVFWDAATALQGDSHIDSLPDFCRDRNRIEIAVNQLKDMALIRRSGRTFSIHRLTQDSFFLRLSPSDATETFHRAVSIICYAFPKSVDGLPLLDRWHQCQAAIKHALALAQTFVNAKKDRQIELLTTSEPLQELVKNCVWYLYERGEQEDALELLRKAQDMFPSKDNLLYAHMCNSEHVIHFELNNLDPSERALQKAYNIQSRLLPGDDTELANTHGNLGTLKATQGRFDESLKYLDIADRARLKAGKIVEVPYAINQTTYAWVLARMGKYDEARERLDRANAIYAKRSGIGQLIAHLLYEYGNLEFFLDRMENARDIYHEGLEMSRRLNPLHILTASYRYKLGVVQRRLRNYPAALEHFNAALDITEKKKLIGATARIMRGKAILIRSDPRSTPQDMSQAQQWEREAEKMKVQVTARFGPEQLKRFRELAVSEDAAYDNLVSPFYQ